MKWRALVSLFLAVWVVAAAPAVATERRVDPDACRSAVLAASDGSPLRTGPCPGVRPGGRVFMTTGGGCSFNFVFDGYRYDGDERVFDGRYIGTAGHCVIGAGRVEDDEASWSPGEGPGAEDSERRRIGDFVYAVLQPRPDHREPKDFGLIKLRDGVAANPQMCHFGGPQGTNEQVTSTGVFKLRHSGQGVGFGPTVPGRTAIAYGFPSPHFVFAYGAAIFGESGSGVIDADGNAVGVLVAVGALTSASTGPAHSGTLEITRLGPQIRRAEEVLGIDLELKTAPPIDP